MPQASKEFRDILAFIELKAIQAADDRRHRDAALLRLLGQRLIQGQHIGACQVYQEMRRQERQGHAPRTRSQPPPRRYEPCEYAQAFPED